MMVASQWKISSSDRGPAEQEVGGSFCKSCLNSLRGAQEEQKCVDVVSWSAFAIQVRRTDEVSDEICLSRSRRNRRRTDERKEAKRRKMSAVCTREIKRKNTDASAKVSQFRERNLVECYLYSKRVRKRTTSSLVIRFEAILMCFSLCYFFLSR